jgi:hypothetical protein
MRDTGLKRKAPPGVQKYRRGPALMATAERKNQGRLVEACAPNHKI